MSFIEKEICIRITHYVEDRLESPKNPWSNTSISTNVQIITGHYYLKLNKMRTCKFLEQSYSPFPSRRCGQNPEQPMLEELKLEKSRRRHIWPSKDWTHCGTGKTMRSPSMLRDSHCCCCSHRSPFLPLQPGNALCDTQHKMEQREIPQGDFLIQLVSLSLHCRHLRTVT